MSDGYVGEIRLFGFNYAPVNWAVCDGSLLAIADNEPLFTLLGTSYGGDGQTTFGLPDLRGRLPLHQGEGPGRVSRPFAERGGAEQAQLAASNLPPHAHEASSSGAATTTRPGLPARGGSYAESGSQGSTTTATGSGLAFDARDPYQVGNFCISLSGSYPSRQ